MRCAHPRPLLTHIRPEMRGSRASCNVKRVMMVGTSQYFFSRNRKWSVVSVIFATICKFDMKGKVEWLTADGERQILQIQKLLPSNSDIITSRHHPRIPFRSTRLNSTGSPLDRKPEDRRPEHQRVDGRPHAWTGSHWLMRTHARRLADQLLRFGTFIKRLDCPTSGCTCPPVRRGHVTGPIGRLVGRSCPQ
ncbi:hypothetical protein NP493_210g01009 [Ridgeia piscesae]|uniref:Uncharacterized protein n=1 Tax=Ridgeia piscesae TaxID=27915 RepID=A0AAD9UED1_RIDPI|nr:hypothetical protein NP493_210g01009 [Ridgeia piscesae]